MVRAVDPIVIISTYHQASSIKPLNTKNTPKKKKKSKGCLQLTKDTKFMVWVDI